MKRALTIFLLIFFALACCAQTKNQDAFDKFIDSLLRRDSIPGVTFMIAKDGAIIKQKGYGFSNLENNVPAKIVTEYEIASVTKPFTATATMLLIEQGKLALDSSISRYLPGVPDSYKKITIRNLMTHTSGLVDRYYDTMKLYGPSVLRYSVNEQLNYLFSQKLKFSPGTRFSYSSAGFFSTSSYY